jgi:hypothetical protein
MGGDADDEGDVADEVGVAIADDDELGVVYDDEEGEERGERDRVGGYSGGKRLARGLSHSSRAGPKRVMKLHTTFISFHSLSSLQPSPHIPVYIITHSNSHINRVPHIRSTAELGFYSDM